jgi:GalNAc5-diNAcBac-PP-undecaprenol beta-1,3-glucosyltransferase
MIFFSIIIPAYNRAQLLTETINSALNQSYTHFEVIVVDDGSTDNTGQVIKEVFGADSRVKYFYKQNEERAAARNFGLKQAKGDFAVFFDSDDWMKPHYLETMNRAILEEPSVFLVAGKYDYDNKGKTENHPVLKNLKEGWYDRQLFLKGNLLACNYCIRIKDHSFSFFPENRTLASMEDWLFLLSNLEQKRIYIVDKVVLTMRQHESRSMLDNKKVIDARKKATDWAIQNLQVSISDQRILKAWSDYFCGIHYYLDNKGGKAIRQAFSAIKKTGPDRKFIFLLIKAIVGRKFIEWLKKV